jgi:hypothetical protein
MQRRPSVQKEGHDDEIRRNAKTSEDAHRIRTMLLMIVTHGKVVLLDNDEIGVGIKNVGRAVDQYNYQEEHWNEYE